MLASRFPIAIVWGREKTTLHNDAFRTLLSGKGSGNGRAFDDIWSEAWNDIGPIWEKAMAGEPTYIEDYRLVVERNDFPEEAYFTFCYSAIMGHDGQVLGMMDTVVETTSSVHAMRQAHVANSELAHRMRNLIAMIAGIARQTLKGSKDIVAPTRTFLDRLAALGTAQTLLANDEGHATTVAALLMSVAQTRLVNLDALTCTGPDVHLGSRQSTSASLAFNELITNAVKHGALSVECGQVSANWTLKDKTFSFLWQETNGPVTERPQRRGFGSQLLEDIVPSNLNGQAALDYAPEGIRYRLTAPLPALD